MGPLDSFRDIPERAQWVGKTDRSPLHLSSVVAAGRRATARMSSRTRIFVWTMLPLEVVLACLNPWFADSLAGASNGSDPLAAGVALLRTPSAATQPVVLAAAAVLLIVMAVATRGFTRVTTVTSRISMAGAVAGIVAGLPCALVLLAFILLIAIGVAVAIGIGVLIVSVATG